VLESMIEPLTSVVCQRRFLPVGRGDYSYEVDYMLPLKCYASAKMFAFASEIFLKYHLELHLL
jgi:hypothetical protein